MSLLSLLPTIGSLIGGPVEKIVDRLGEDERNEFMRSMKELDSEMQMAKIQAEINAAEAKHASLFVAGWRPFIGWACGCVLVLSAIVAIWGAVFGMTPAQIAALGEVRAMLMPILLGLLGLGGMRSFEKFKGVSRERLR